MIFNVLRLATDLQDEMNQQGGRGTDWHGFSERSAMIPLLMVLPFPLSGNIFSIVSMRWVNSASRLAGGGA
jgi:hypothetical protein